MNDVWTRYLGFSLVAVVVALLPGVCVRGQTAEVPRVAKTADASRLLVEGKPFLVLGGELGNSSAGTAAQADTILPHMAAMHVNTVLMPVAWEQMEPVEGKFDFGILDHWIDVARGNHVHLGLLWFGAWKNAFSEYAPGWVKADTRRFPRAVGADGAPLEILSTLGPETMKADARAFAALMGHVKEKDAGQNTVLLVQVENEVGFLGRGGRDRSAAADALFREPVPRGLVEALRKEQAAFSPQRWREFHPDGHSWPEVFGDGADEAFMAWSYARYIEAVTAAGKRAYPLPMYANAQLPAPLERAGEYPSGAPYPANLAMYRAVATSLNFVSPDIYWPDFEGYVKQYAVPGNAMFVPEARMDAAPWNALYLYGQAQGFGFSAFGIDSLHADGESKGVRPDLADTYAALSGVSDLILAAQSAGTSRGLVLHAASPRPTQTVAVGGYLLEATLARSWPARALMEEDGGMLVLPTAPDEFVVIGSGLSVQFWRDPDADDRVAGILSVEEVSRQEGRWTVLRRLNGDQTDQGRQLMMDAHAVKMYRVRLYAVSAGEGRR